MHTNELNDDYILSIFDSEIVFDEREFNKKFDKYANRPLSIEEFRNIAKEMRKFNKCIIKKNKEFTGKFTSMFKDLDYDLFVAKKEK